MSLLKKIFLNPGDIIYNQGDLATDVYLMNKGVVTLTHTEKNGNEQLFKSIKKGQVFGKIALSHNEVREYTARAQTEVTCATISVKKLYKRVEQQDPFIGALFRILVANLNSIKELGVSPKESLEEMIEIADEKNE